MLDSMAGCGEGTAPCRSSGMLPVIALIVVVRFLLWTVFLRTLHGNSGGKETWCLLQETHSGGKRDTRDDLERRFG